MNQILTQGIGYIALLCVVFSFQKKDRKSLLLIMLSGLLLFVVHYFLLGAWTGLFMNLIEAGVVFVSYKKENSTWAMHFLWPYVFVTAYSIAGIFTVQHYTDILPIIAQVIAALAVWQKNPRIIRLITLIPRPLWFVYNFIVGSQAGMVAEVVIFISIIAGIVRFDILHKKED